MIWYFIVASKLEDKQAEHILFFNGKKATDRWTTLSEEVTSLKKQDEVW